MRIPGDGRTMGWHGDGKWRRRRRGRRPAKRRNAGTIRVVKGPREISRGGIITSGLISWRTAREEVGGVGACTDTMDAGVTTIRGLAIRMGTRMDSIITH